MSRIIQQLKSLNVLVIGDCCTDIFRYGTCTRLSPEAPVPILDLSHEKVMPGMSGNVYTNLKNLGINAELIKNDEELKKIRFIDLKTKQHILRMDTTNIIKKIDICKITKFDYDAVIISDYDKGFIPIDIIEPLLNLFKCPIFVDSKKNDLSNYENCIIKINESEFSKIIKFPKDYEVIITLGENGATYKGETIPTNKVQVFDVSGAGDTFMASLVVKYLLTKDLKQAIKFANTCASIVVKKSGTASIMLSEVNNEIRI